MWVINQRSTEMTYRKDSTMSDPRVNYALFMNWWERNQEKFPTFQMARSQFTLLALNDFEYDPALDHINLFFDRLSVSWLEADSREAALAMQVKESGGKFRYPLNIQSNRHPELSQYVHHVKSVRQEYKSRYVKIVPQ